MKNYTNDELWDIVDDAFDIAITFGRAEVASERHDELSWELTHKRRLLMALVTQNSAYIDPPKKMGQRSCRYRRTNLDKILKSQEEH